MIETNLIYAKTKSGFQAKLDASEVKNTSIAFIEDSNEIWTNGHYWPCPYSKEEIDNLLAQKITSEQLEQGLENKQNTLESGAIPSISKELTNEDLNTITNPGFYYAKEDNTVTNKPGGITSFGVVVYPVSDTAYMQILYRDDNCQYHRIHNGSDWGNWERELTTTDSASYVKTTSSTKTIWTGSQTEYGQISVKDENTLYFITEENI